MQGARASSPGELTPAIFPPSQLFWRERVRKGGGGENKRKKNIIIKEVRKKKKKSPAKPTKLGRVGGAGRARQPPGALGLRCQQRAPRPAAGLHDIRRAATPSRLNRLLPAPLPAARPRGSRSSGGAREGKAQGKGGRSKRLISQPIKGLFKQRRAESDAHL